MYRGTKCQGIYTAEVIYSKEAIGRPTILYVLYCIVSVQQMNPLPENASLNDGMFALSLYHIYRTTSQCLSDCTIVVLYFIHIVF